MRKTIRQYLDDPSLLADISIEQLQYWADEVPYASIIHQLMAMKVVQEEQSLESRQMIQKAAMHSPNPIALSRDLQRASSMKTSEISHTYPSDTTEASSDLVSTRMESEIPTTVVPVIEENEFQEESLDFKDQDDNSSDQVSESKEFAPEDEAPDGEELSSFSSWLLSLRQIKEINQDLTEGDTILNGHDNIASEALAELLVQQGHKRRAISMYQQLMLKYPEKSSFFADQIEKISTL